MRRRGFTGMRLLLLGGLAVWAHTAAASTAQMPSQIRCVLSHATLAVEWLYLPGDHDYRLHVLGGKAVEPVEVTESTYIEDITTFVDDPDQALQAGLRVKVWAMPKGSPDDGAPDIAAVRCQ